MSSDKVKVLYPYKLRPASSHPLEKSTGVVLDMEQLKCPICLDFPRAEMYLCPNGHSVCNECIDKLTNCGTCRVPYPKYGGKQRNYYAEGFLDSVLFSCSWKGEGCKEGGLKRQELTRHELRCEFSPNPVKLCDMLFPGDCSYDVPSFILRRPNTDRKLVATLCQHFEKTHTTLIQEVICQELYIQRHFRYFMDSSVNKTGNPLYNGSIIHLFQKQYPHSSVGWFMIFCYKDVCPGDDVKLSWFFVHLTYKPQSYFVSVKFLLRSPVKDKEGKRKKISWDGESMTVFDLKEFRTQTGKERNKFKVSLSLAELRKDFLNAEGGLDLQYVFTVTTKEDGYPGSYCLSCSDESEEE